MGCVKGSLCADPTHAVSCEFEAVSVVDEAVEAGVGEGWVADDVGPEVYGDLAGDDG